MDILITGVLLGATYSLIAMGLNLQYGVARIMNLANGEMLVAGAFGAFWVYTAQSANPFAAALFVVPGAFLLNWLIYRYLLRPLVRRAKNRGMLEVDTMFTPDVAGDSAFIAPGQKSFSFKVTAKKGSSLYYYCAIHPWMQGKLKVN